MMSHLLSVFLVSKCALFKLITFIVCKFADDISEPADCIDGTARLVGESPHRGRLEICQNRVWGTVCASDRFAREWERFSVADANDFCEILGYQPSGEA